MAPELYGIGEAGIYLPTGDVAATTDWYAQVLDVEPLHGADHYRFLDLDADGSARQRLILFDPAHTREQDTPAPHGTDETTHIALDVPLHDLPDWRERLEAHDVEITYERDWTGDAHSLYFDDPAGNSLELMGLRTDALPRDWTAPPLNLATALEDVRDTIDDAYTREWDALETYLDEAFADYGGVDRIGPGNAYTVATVKIGAYLSGADATYAETAEVQGCEKDAAQLSRYAAELKDAMELDERLQGSPERAERRSA